MEHRTLVGAGIVGAIVVALVALLVGRGDTDDARDPTPPSEASDEVADVGDADGHAADEGDIDANADVAASAPVVTASREVTHPTTWLCGHDASDDLCDVDLDTTIVDADGATALVPFTPAAEPPVDCFYVYPTVSEHGGDLAPLEVTDAERRVVGAQAGRFAEVCRVVAPLYRQVTRDGVRDRGLEGGDAVERAFADVLSAFNDHLARAGERPFVLVGHSQGALHLHRLLEERIVGDPELRPRLVSALLVGWHVLAPDDDPTTTSAGLPPCTSPTDTGCVVAYNSFDGAPPPGTLFGRAPHGSRVVCVHPAAPGEGGGPLTPVLPVPEDAELATPFVTFEGALEAACRSDGLLTWLEVTAEPDSLLDLDALDDGTRLPWGLHVADVNLALQDLIELVRAQAGAHADA